MQNFNLNKETETITKFIFSKTLGTITFVIDREDESIFNFYKPVANKMSGKIYIRATQDSKYFYLSHLIMKINKEDKVVIKYIDGNPLNLTKSNLLIVDKKKHVLPYLPTTKQNTENLKEFNKAGSVNYIPSIKEETILSKIRNLFN